MDLEDTWSIVLQYQPMLHPITTQVLLRLVRGQRTVSFVADSKDSKWMGEVNFQIAVAVAKEV